jgi:hypothetical protein
VQRESEFVSERWNSIGYREEAMLEMDEGQEVAYNYALGCSCDNTSSEELGLAVLPHAYQSVGDRQQSDGISAYSTAW